MTFTLFLAQTLTTDASAPQKTWEVFLKVLFPAVWTALSPFITGWITAGIKQVPTPFQIVISSVIGALMAGAAGAIPDFPLTMESAATMGASGGAMGQILANMDPKTTQPKTTAASTPPTS